MERKKVSLSLKTGTSRKRSKEPSIGGGCITPKCSSKRKGILKEGISNKANLSESPLSNSGSYLNTLDKSKFQNDGLDFHCSFETDGSSEQDIDIPCTQPVSHDKILEGVVAFIEARSNTENRFEGISKQMEMLGATVVKKFTPEVTHVIFKDGKKTTREKAIKKGIHLVSVLWVESCRQSGKHVSEDLFPVVEPEQAVTPLMIGRLKRTKSMQPKAFEEDVQNSADRGDRRRKRKLQAENLTPTAMVFCAETQDPCSPITVNPPLTPHMVSDTPCHEITSPLTKALSYAPVDGHWGRWSSWGACSARCDNGTRVRTRKCDDPSPADSGKPCPGDDEQQEACIIKRCSSGPLDCDFDFVGSCPHWSTKNDNSGKFEWTKGSGATPSSNTGPSADHTTGAGNYLYVEASSPAQEGNKAWLLHDQFPATAGRCLSFWYHMYGASTGTLNVYIVDKDDKSTLVWSKYGDQGNQWNEAKFTLESKLDYKVMFEAVRGASFQGDMALDDIGFTNGPCMEEVGCFQDNEEHRAFPTMLKNLRSAIDWHHLEKIVQKYAMLTKENNYKVFAIQFYGGCWSGESPKVQYDRWGAVDESQCKLGVGGENINAVYRLVP